MRKIALELKLMLKLLNLFFIGFEAYEAIPQIAVCSHVVYDKWYKGGSMDIVCGIYTGGSATPDYFIAWVLL